MAAGRRRVLLIGVGAFQPAALDAVPSPTTPSYPDLPFAPERIDRLAKALRTYRTGEFGVDVLVDPTLAELGPALNKFLQDNEVEARIVYVISHGGHDPTQRRRLDMMPTCLSIGTDTNVHNWISTAQTLGTPTLFLVDLCGSGRVANPDDLGELTDEEVKAWTLTASRSDEDAIGGHFSEIVAEVLEDCGRTGLGTDSSVQFVGFDLFANQVRDLMLRRYGQVQQVRWTKAESHLRLSLPFFPNPGYQFSPLAARLAQLTPPLRPFLDDRVADAKHFQLRAGDHFTGRQSQLEQLVPWFDGSAATTLCVVTGKPGAGKSALLGALVCAAHPELIDLVPQVRASVSPCPQPNPHLAAVHARQQTLDDLIESLTVQLGIEVSGGESWNAAELCSAVAQLPAQPVIVLDALDECPQYPAVQAVLLMPLTNTRRPDGAPACRLLVGVRPHWDDFDPLFSSAKSSGLLIDLDESDPNDLRNDLDGYVRVLLGQRPYRELLAAGVSSTLTDQRRDWGEFLVAERYVSYLARRYPQAISEVLDRIHEMPTELPEIFEREMSLHEDSVELRAALTAVAFAKGTGMPEQLAATVAQALGSSIPGVLVGTNARVYLRLSIDTDGSSLYRLYHEGLADYLRKQQSAVEVFDAITATRDTLTGRRSWESAPRYLKHHAIEHATDVGDVDSLITDAEFLVHADPASLMTSLSNASTPAGRLAEAVYRVSYHQFQDDPEWRRMILRLNALRYGALDLANLLGG